MRRIFSLFAVLAIIFASNCSRIPENNDPVIGIWTNTLPAASGNTSKQQVRQEWIFNDAYLGRYHRYEGNILSLKTDFQWKKEDALYRITYPGTTLPTNRVLMKEGPDGESFLEDEKGNILAERE